MRSRPFRFRQILIATCALQMAWVSPVVAQVPEDSPRMSPLVKVIAKVERATVALFIQDPKTKKYSSGSGALIHPAGYILTNDHVVLGSSGYAVLQGKLSRFRTIGRLPEKDIAIVRLTDFRGRLPTIPLGQSHDVMNGEAVVVAGNPGGRGIVTTSGIISSKRAILDMPSALAATQYDTSFRDDYLRFDAASNRGNSGGPLVNMEGKIIGVVSRIIADEQNASFAIPIDRVRRLLEQVVEPEMVHRRFVGLKLNPRADAAIVSEVTGGSPAQIAGLQPGDTIVSVDATPVRHAADWTLMMEKVLSQGDTFAMVARRGNSTLPVEITASPFESFESVEVPDAKPGIAYDFFHGEYKVLPSFDELTVHRQGVAASLDLDAIRGDREEEFAIVAEGFLKIPWDGLYRITITSDDGSRVHWHDQMLIDHDGNHPPMAASRMVRANAGLHPIKIEYFEGGGHQALELELDPIEIDSKPKDDSDAEAQDAEAQDAGEGESAGPLEYFHNEVAS